MNEDDSKIIIPVERIERAIHFIRGQKVILDQDLAALYGVKTKVLNQAVKRNIERFPEDFMFQLNKEETEISRSQIVTLKRGMNIKYLPYVFTEQGVAMLSSVIKSQQAIAINIEIVRTFIQLRHVLAEHKEMSKELVELKAFTLKHSHANDREFKRVWEAIDKLINPPAPKDPPRRIGFDLSRGKKL